MNTLLKKIDENTQWNWLKDFLIPLLSTALTSYFVYQNKKAPDETEMDPSFEKMHETFSKLPKNDQYKIRMIMKNPTIIPPAPKPNPKLEEKPK